MDVAYTFISTLSSYLFTLPGVQAVTEKKSSIFPQSTIGDGVRIYNETSVSPGSEGGKRPGQFGGEVGDFQSQMGVFGCV